MRKGFFASVAALAASAGVACGQGGPGAPAAAPASYPGYGAAAVGAPQPLTPAGFPPAAGMPIPPATEMPHYGVVPPPSPAYDPWKTDPGYVPGAEPANYSGAPTQVHKAAGGPDRWYIDIENLAWRVKPGPIAFPLAVASPPMSAGVLGQEGTRVILGDENLDWGNYQNVGRFTFGWWGRERDWGFELSGFIQEAKSDIFNFNAPITGREVLARPVIDAFTGLTSAVLIGFPGRFGGELHSRSTIKLGGAEANLLWAGVYCDRFKLNGLFGIRYIDHDENLLVITRTTVPANQFDPTVPPDLIDTSDEFAVRNQFVGANIGFQHEWRRGRWFVDTIAKVAVGNMNQQLVIDGFSSASIAGVDARTPGGILALEGNIGSSDRNRFCYVPELTLKFGYQWTQRLSGYIGYNLMYISDILRPGDQIDPFVNPTLLPVSNQFGNFFGPVRPVRTFNETDMTVHGVTFGMQIRY